MAETIVTGRGRVRALPLCLGEKSGEERKQRGVNALDEAISAVAWLMLAEIEISGGSNTRQVELESPSVPSSSGLLLDREQYMYNRWHSP